MSSKEPRINSYSDFKDEMLPRIRSLGYNTIQIMAVQEHAYYGSFGYHVTNFFAVRCWQSCRRQRPRDATASVHPGTSGAKTPQNVILRTGCSTGYRPSSSTCSEDPMPRQHAQRR